MGHKPTTNWPLIVTICLVFAALTVLPLMCGSAVLLYEYFFQYGYKQNQ